MSLLSEHADSGVADVEVPKDCGSGRNTFEDAERELNGLGKAAYKVEVVHRKAIGCGVCSALALGLVVYCSSAYSAATEIGASGQAHMKIHKSQNLCGQWWRLSGEVQISNPSSWSASISMTAFHMTTADGVLLIQAEGAGIQPGTLRLPPNSNEWQPIALDLKIADIQRFGSVVAETLWDGTVNVSIDLTYTAGLDDFPLKSSGTLRVLVTTELPDATPGTSASQTGDGDAVVRVGKLEFSATILSVDPPTVTDTAKTLSATTKVVVSASWPVCLLLHTFSLPAVNISTSSDGEKIATLRVVRYKLPDEYSYGSWENSAVEFWLEGQVTPGQASAARITSNLLASAEPEIPLSFGITPGDCSVLRIADVAFGQYSTTVGGLLSNGTRAAAERLWNGTWPAGAEQSTPTVGQSIDGAADEVHSGLYFNFTDVSYESALNWIGFVSQNRSAYSARAAGVNPEFPEDGIATSTSMEMFYRPGSLAGALALAQPWTRLIVGIPIRRCAEAEQACLADPDCAAIVNAVADPMSPTSLEMLRCSYNSLCAYSLAQCISRPEDPAPVGISVRFDTSPARHHANATDSVRITATYPQAQMTGMVQNMLDNLVSAIYDGSERLLSFNMWQISLVANPRPRTVLGTALGARLNLITPPDVGQMIASLPTFQQEEQVALTEVTDEEEEVENELEEAGPTVGDPCPQATPRPTWELLPRRARDTEQTLRTRIVWSGPPSDPDKQLRTYPDNRVSVKLYFDSRYETHWSGWSSTAPPNHTDAQRMIEVEFEGNMLITQIWTFDVTLFSGLPLEHFATQTIQYSRREDGLAFGLDISLDDDAVVMPLNLVLRQLPRQCGGGPDGVAGGNGGGRGDGRRPGGHAGDGVGDSPTQDCGPQNEGPDLRFYTNLHTRGSIMDYSGSATMELSNPLGVGYGIKYMDLRVDKMVHQWVRGSPHHPGHSVTHPRIVTQIHLESCHSSPCVYVPANCTADKPCGRVPLGVTGTLIASVSEVQDTEHLELNINGRHTATSSELLHSCTKCLKAVVESDFRMHCVHFDIRRGHDNFCAWRHRIRQQHRRPLGASRHYYS